MPLNTGSRSRAIRILQFGNTDCQVCGAAALEEVVAFERLARVTSDCRPWATGGRLCVCTQCGVAQKVVDDRWLGEIAAIYNQYSIYHQAAGSEQPIFTSHGPRLRSKIIAETVIREIELPNYAKVLDFGCGNGAMLRAFSGEWPDWQLFGSELSDNVREKLNTLPNFKKLFVGSLCDVDEKFDLITMIHALEHVVDPVKVLSEVGRLLGASGRLLVEVPNCAATPYDLIIADHLTHFTSDAMIRISWRAGYATQLLSDDVISKELTWIGRRDGGSSPQLRSPGAGDRVKLTLAHVEWLAGQIESASKIARRSKRFGIFGTSISGTWLGGALGDMVSFFVDEDPSRIGRSHLGKPILAPRDVPESADVFVPLIPTTARVVSERLSGQYGRYFTPEEIDL